MGSSGDVAVTFVGVGSTAAFLGKAFAASGATADVGYTVDVLHGGAD